MYIGIERYSGLVYEGNYPYGHALWPAPVVTSAKIVFASDGPLVAARSNDPIHTSCKFREDQFDPIARIRRGRFYFGDGVQSQPSQWYVQPHPALATESCKTKLHDIQKSLETFVGHSFWQKSMSKKREHPLVLLGIEDRFTVWNVIQIEAMYTGEDLVTLKARGSLGTLPELNERKLPKVFRARVRDSLDAFADEVHRSAPVSVIDRARDAASQVLLAHYNLTGNDAQDLAKLANRLEQDDLIVAASAAKIIARLHSRAKPSERERRKMRAIREQDAEMAGKCLGTLLCEIDLAEWA